MNFLDSLNRNNVDYMVVDGFAVNIHGFTRSTADMDIWIDTKKDSSDCLLNSFLELDYKMENSSKAIGVLTAKHIIKSPLDNAKIELVDNFIVSGAFEKCYKNHIKTNICSKEVLYIGFEDLIECKEKSNSMKDLLDVKNLKELRKLRNKNQYILKPKKDKDNNPGNDFGMSM